MNKTIKFIIFFFAVYTLQRDIGDIKATNFVDTISCKQKEDTSFFSWEFHNSNIKDTLNCFSEILVFIDTNSNKIDTFQLVRVLVLSPYRKSYDRQEVFSFDSELEKSEIIVLKDIFNKIDKEILSLNNKEYEYINTNRPMDYKNRYIFITRFKVFPLQPPKENRTNHPYKSK